MKLTNNFTLTELTDSNTALRLGIDNEPNGEQLTNLLLLCQRILQPLRDELGESITITSGLRNEALNSAIGGSKSSDHCKGLAADIQCSDNKILFDTIIALNLPYSQLIWEFGTSEAPKWVHVALDITGNPKRQLLKAFKQGGKTKYNAII